MQIFSSAQTIEVPAIENVEFWEPFPEDWVSFQKNS
jgi:hypothetical protein